MTNEKNDKCKMRNHESRVTSHELTKDKRRMPKIKSKRFHLVSLGCSKNTVDSESMAQLLERDGYQACAEARQADVLIVNTCGFIGPAKQESLNVLNQLAEAKRP